MNDLNPQWQAPELVNVDPQSASPQSDVYPFKLQVRPEFRELLTVQTFFFRGLQGIRGHFCFS